MNKKLFLGLLVFMCGSILSLSAGQIDGKGLQQFKIGNIEATVVTDGFFHFQPIQPVIAPAATSQELYDFMEHNHEDPNFIDLGLNILLLKQGDHLILFDTGGGTALGQTAGWLAQNLPMIGISPDQITEIFITHAHPDHIFGLVSADGKSIYPNATIYMPTVEYNFWVNGTPDFSKSKNPQKDDAAAMGGMLQGIRNALAVIKPQTKLINEGDELLGTVTVKLAPGHTGGHSIYTISSEGDKLTVLGDLVHSSAILFTYPEWGVAFDWDFAIGVKTRIAVLKELYSNNSYIFGVHLPYPGVGRLKELGTNSYEWVPRAFATPQLR